MPETSVQMVEAWITRTVKQIYQLQYTLRDLPLAIVGNHSVSNGLRAADVDACFCFGFLWKKW